MPERKRLSVLFAGVGGQGIVLSAELLSEAVFRLGLEVAMLQGYGAEVRGGPVYAYVVISEERIENVFVEEFDAVFLLHRRPLEIWRHMFDLSKILIFDSDLVPTARGLGLPLTKIAVDRGVGGCENIVTSSIAAALANLDLSAVKEAYLGYLEKRIPRCINAVELGFELYKSLAGSPTASHSTQ